MLMNNLFKQTSQLRASWFPWKVLNSPEAFRMGICATDFAVIILSQKRWIAIATVFGKPFQCAPISKAPGNGHYL
jgi:hypothetical protein